MTENKNQYNNSYKMYIKTVYHLKVKKKKYKVNTIYFLFRIKNIIYNCVKHRLLHSGMCFKIFPV